MPDNPIPKQYILHHLPCPDVMDDKVSLVIIRLFIHHDPNMRYPSAKVPANNVSGHIILRILCDWQRSPVSIKKCHKIRNPSMINVPVGCA